MPCKRPILAVALAALAVSAAVVVPAAAARGDRHRPRPYRVIGRVPKSAGGAWCFGAKWHGNGGWDYTGTGDVVNGSRTTHSSAANSSVYSWDINQGAHAMTGFCKYGPGLKPTGLFSWLGGTARTGLKINEEISYTGPNAPPPVTASCEPGKTVPESKAVGASSADLVVRHGSVTFTAGPLYAYITPPCNSGLVGYSQYIPPTAHSVAIPLSVLDTAKEIVVTISSEHNQGKPNCQTDTPHCAITGGWQGSLTLTRARNG